MFECQTTNQESVQTVQKAAARFDPRRIYTVLVVAPLLYGTIQFLPAFAFTCLVAAAGNLALFELYRLLFQPSSRRLAVAIGLAGCTALILAPHHPMMVQPILLIALIAVLSIPLLNRVPLQHSFNHSAVIVMGMCYVGLGLSYLVQTRLQPKGEWLVFFLLLVTWAGDTGAYYVGTRFGQRALAPRISPRKTVEGLIGGLLSAIIIAYLARWWFLPTLSGVDCAIVAFLLTLLGMWGDLAESALKRSAGAKDSGGILPGHGGMLDRLDSLLFTAPAFYYYVTSIRGFAS